MAFSLVSGMHPKMFHYLRGRPPGMDPATRPATPNGRAPSALDETREFREEPPVAMSGVSYLEGEWAPDLRERASVLPVLELLGRRCVIERSIAT